MTVAESHLWRAWQSRRDGQAFEALVRPHLRFLQDFARRLGLHPADADDVVQSALVDLALERSDRPQRVGLRAWLGRSARSHALMLFRSSRRRARREAKAPAAASPASTVEIDDQVQAALSQLDDKARQAVILRYLHDLDYKEVAHVLKISEAGCRIRVHRAIARLRRSLGKSAPAAIAALTILSGRADARAAVSKAAFGSAATTGGLLLMSAKAKIAIVLLLVTTVGFVSWQATRERTAPPARTDRPEVRAEVPLISPAVTPVEPKEPHESATTATQPAADAPVAPDKGSVRGTVRFLDGTSAEGLRVSLWGHSEIEDVTDEEGRFHLHNDWVGSRWLYMLGPNDYMFILSRAIEMKAGERVEVEVDLERGIDFEGRLISGASEEPIAGAQVTLRFLTHREGQGSSGFVKTDTDGRFGFRFVPRTRYSLDFVAKGFEAKELRFDLTHQPAPEIVRLKDSRTLVVRIEDAPEAAAGTEIPWSLNRAEGAVSPSGDTPLSNAGELLIDAPPPGTYQLILFRSKHLPRFEKKVAIGDGPLTPVVFRMKAGATVTGTLRDATGEPMPSETLWAGKVKIRTGDDGRFTFARVPGGRKTFKLGVPNGMVSIGEAEIPLEGEHEIDLVLPGTGAIVGQLGSVGNGTRVSLHAGDKPADNAFLQLQDPHWIASLNRAKELRIPHLAAGTYVLVARVFNGDRMVRRVTVAAGETVDLGDLGLRAYPEVPFEVTVPAGVRLPAYVHVTYRLAALNGLKEELWGGGSALDEQGRGTVRGPAPGTQEMTFQADGFEDCRVTTHVGDEMAPVRVQLQPNR